MIPESDLAGCVRQSLDEYFLHLDGEKPSAIYDMVVGHVEKPLLEYILNYAQGNQTKAAEMLGLNRNTLRKKMKDHGLQ